MADPQIGSYLGVYYVLDGHHDEWNRWAVDQVNVLHAAGRMFEERDHIHTGLYRFEWEHRRDEDGVPAELTLDHRFPGMVSVFVEPADGVDAGPDRRLVPPATTCPRCCPARRWPPCWPSAPSRCWPTPPATCPAPSSRSRRCSCSGSSTRSPPARGTRLFAQQDAAVSAAGLGRVQWASPFIGTVPGTDTYTDQLWSNPGAR